MTAAGQSLRHLLDESKESLIEAERAFLSKALASLTGTPSSGHHLAPLKLCKAPDQLGTVQGVLQRC